MIIAHPHPEAVAFGADFAPDLASARQRCAEFPYPVVVTPGDLTARETQLAFFAELAERSPHSQRVIIRNDTDPETLRDLVNKGGVFKILPSFIDPEFDRVIQEALEKHDFLQQNAQLLQLVNEQNERLKKLSIDLEARVEKRQRFLEDAREKLLVTNHRVEALHRALVAVHRASSIAEMERLITEALSGALGLSWTRISFRSQGTLQSHDWGDKGYAIFSVSLGRGREALGQVLFAREAKRPFTKDEHSFLHQIAEAASLAIDRLLKLEESETLKHQWEATFDAILEPVSIVDKNYVLLRLNRSFAAQSASTPEKLIGRKCFEALYGRSSPCAGCRIGSNFRLKPAKTAGGEGSIYDVFSQEIQFKPDETTLFVNMYHDVSAQLRLERQILESAKMAELGTIGSSIAHELNNPLGGMLSFLQLIKMDLKGDEPYYDDISEMEEGARRCRDIVKSLLGFTRKSSADDDQAVDLREVVEQALKISELQTRAMGIRLSVEMPEEPVTIKGQFNFLAQAVRNFLQNAQEAIAERARAEQRFEGEIRIRLDAVGSDVTLEITDNGVGLPDGAKERIYDPLYTTKDPVQNPGLGLTVAQQIISDHKGKAEISSSPRQGTTAKISFPRPVFNS